MKLQNYLQGLGDRLMGEGLDRFDRLGVPRALKNYGMQSARGSYRLARQALNGEDPRKEEYAAAR
ncbi:MAG: hypothetical protein HY367_02795 [Candidatus Aenigmarchaeota archaeon]|nr:hypothetical protein [Candidatus Aenigmarchaeota archaeon]